MGKMEGYCLTGQSPQWAVVPMEEEEGEEEEEEEEWSACNLFNLDASNGHFALRQTLRSNYCLSSYF
jgi:hypothetical protein